MKVLTQSAPWRVVIVDDTADLRDLLRLALDRGGFEVVGEAGDGRTGIEVVRRERPDVVLLDLAMPVMDGIEALPAIRRHCPDARIVVLSGFGAQQISARAVAAGADGYVQKGAPLRTILDYVRQVADGVPQRTAGALSVVPADAAGAGQHADLLGEDSPSTPVVAPSVHDRETGAPGGSAGSVPPNVSAWDALRLAPYGVLELADEPLFRLVHANATAARLLGTDKPGAPLSTFAPELATLVPYYRLDSDASFEVQVGGHRVRASLRRTGWSVLVFLDSAAEDVGLLRRAIATTAHEVRGPVAVLCGIAETLAWEGNVMSPQQNGKLMASVARQARILDRITADLLTAAQIQRGTLRTDMQRVELRSVIENVIVDRYDVDLVVEDDRPVRADPLRLEQMLNNLLSNAFKYGAAPFRVLVRGDGDHICIDVIDHGAGVPPEFDEHLFREFARAHDAVATGTGLGLYVVRTLAEAQGGQVSHAPGPAGGAVFTITLPAS